MASFHLKESYDVEAQHKAFYTGGRVEWTSDGNLMLCQCGDSISVVDLSSGLLRSTLDSPEDQVYTFALTRDGRHVASAHKSGLIKYWTLESNDVVKLWRSIHKGPIAEMTFDPSGDLLATGGSDGAVKLWNVSRHTCTHSLKGSQGVFSVLVFHPDASRNLVFGSADDSKIISWLSSDGETKNVYCGHFSRVTSLNFTVDGTRMVSSGRDRVLILWDIDSAKALRTLPVYECIEGTVILPIKFQLPGIKIKKSDEGVYVACAGEKGIVKVWNVASSRLIYTQSDSLVSAASHDGNLAVVRLLLNEVRGCLSVVSVDHNIIVYDLATFECHKQMVGFTDEILDIIFVGRDDTHVAVASNSVDIKVYELATMNCQLLKGHTDLVLSLSRCDHNPRLFLSSGKDNTIRTWMMHDVSYTVKCIAVGNRHTSSVGAICMPHMSSSCCFSASEDSCVKRWILPSFENTDGQVSSLMCSHTEMAHSKYINDVTVSPNDNIVASASQDKTVKLWSAENLSSLGTLRGHKRGVWCVKFSPVDQVLLSTSADCTVKLWSLTELNCLKTLEGHSSSVLKAEFMSRGLQIVSAGADGLLKIWCIKSSEAVASLDKHEGRVWAMAVSQSENTIITGGADSLLIKWKDVTVEKRENAAKEREEIAMQEQELTNLLHEKKLTKALRLSLRLNKPMHTLKIINQLLGDDDDGEEGALVKATSQLKPDDVETLIKHCIEWNTNTRHCHAAQTVVNALMSGGGVQVRNPAAVRALLPYTRRHMERVTDALRDLQFLNYTIKCMRPS